MRVAIGVGALVAWAMVAGGALAADSGVTIAGFAFSPQTITIDVGDSVTWTNNDDVDHTATGSGFDTSTITSGGGTATVTFDTAGTFAYACTIHPSMTGTVVVDGPRRRRRWWRRRSTLPPTDTLDGPASAVGGAGTLLLLGLAGCSGRPSRRCGSSAGASSRGDSPATLAGRPSLASPGRPSAGIGTSSTSLGDLEHQRAARMPVRARLALAGRQSHRRRIRSTSEGERRGEDRPRRSPPQRPARFLAAPGASSRPSRGSGRTSRGPGRGSRPAGTANPERVSSWDSSGTRMNRTGRL